MSSTLQHEHQPWCYSFCHHRWIELRTGRDPLAPPAQGQGYLHTTKAGFEHLAVSGLTVRLPVWPWQQVCVKRVRKWGVRATWIFIMTSPVYWLQRGGHTQVGLLGPPESAVNWPGRRREVGGSEHIAHIRVIQVLPVADNWIDEDGFEPQSFMPPGDTPTSFLCHRNLSWHHSLSYSAAVQFSPPPRWSPSPHNNVSCFLLIQRYQCSYRNIDISISGIDHNRTTVAWFAQNCISRVSVSASDCSKLYFGIACSRPCPYR